jgi:hypothetical protein
MILVVSYDLAPDSDSAKFLETLQAQGEWLHYLRNTWLIDTDLNPQGLYVKLEPVFPKGGRIFISQVSSYWGYMPTDTWSWLSERVAKPKPATSA